MKYYLPFFLLLIACQGQPAPEKTSEDTHELSFAETIEAAYHKPFFLQQEVIQFDLLLFFGGTERLNATISLTTNSTQGLIEKKNGEKIYYEHDQVFCLADSDTAKTRFNAYTWPYFFLLPYKLTDPGTQWESYSNNELGGELFETEKLSFEAGTGDAPDDWYIVYANPTDHLIRYAAYIVTYAKSQAEAEEDPHAIEYLDYRNIDGIPISHEWKFWAWNDSLGLTKELGEAQLSHISFKPRSQVNFDPPSNYIKL